MRASVPVHDFCLTVTAEWLAFADHLTCDNLASTALQAAQAARAAGFDGVEIPLPHAQPAIEQESLEYWTDFAQQHRDLGIPVRSVHGPNFPPLSVSFDEALQQLLPQWKIACAMQVEAFVVHPTSHSHPHVTEIAAALLERDVELCERLLEHGSGTTRLAVENLPSYGLIHLQRLLDRIPSEVLGVCFDTGHWNVRPEGSIRTAIEAMGSRIVHMHLSDNPGWCDAHWPPGQGTFPWAEWAESVDSSWWKRPLLVELSVPLKHQTPDAPQQASDCWQTACQQARDTLNTVVPSSAILNNRT